jgi:hypothetical protein
MIRNNTENFSGMVFDCDIAKLIGITKKEYQKILINFGGCSGSRIDIYFNNKTDAKKALEFLNKKYGLILQLLS